AQKTANKRVLVSPGDGACQERAKRCVPANGVYSAPLPELFSHAPEHDPRPRGRTPDVWRHRAPVRPAQPPPEPPSRRRLAAPGGPRGPRRPRDPGPRPLRRNRRPDGRGRPDASRGSRRLLRLLPSHARPGPTQVLEARGRGSQPPGRGGRAPPPLP